jgi:hypothetical protein
MKKTLFSKMLMLLMISTLALFINGCSSDEPEATPSNSSTVKAAKHNKVDEGEASDSVKQKFEKQFTKNCVTRELAASNNPDVEEKRAQDSCSCIAKHIADDLAEVDAEKYLDDNEDTRTLQIKFDTATFFCLQNKQQFRGPMLFGKQ